MIRANANVTIAGNLSNEKSILAQYLESVNWQTRAYLCVEVLTTVSSALIMLALMPSLCVCHLHSLYLFSSSFMHQIL